jgi:Na+/H+ antiporter NhaD/arsenite permease-like protein
VRTARSFLALLGLLICFLGAWEGQPWAKEQAQGQPRLFISGLILDSQLSPVKDAVVRVSLEGQPQPLIQAGREVLEVSSASDGSYILELDPKVPLGEKSKVEVEVSKPCFMTMRIPLEMSDFASKGDSFYFRKDVSLPRKGSPALWIAVSVFAAVYFLMAFELMHRLVAAMLGTAALLLITYTAGNLDADYRIITFHAAVEYVDMNVVLLLLASMVMVGILRQSGVFQWAVWKCFLLSRGRKMTLAALLIFISAGISTLVDNAATMVVLTPATLVLAQGLRMNPLALLLPQVMAANLGGTATLVGDISNMMIGSRGGLSFTDFLENLGPVCGLGLMALLLMSGLWYRKDYRAPATNTGENPSFEARGTIEDPVLLAVGLGVLVPVILLLFTQRYWRMEASVPMLAGASVLFAYGVLSRKIKMMDFLEKEMEWPTLLFLIFLFILVGALKQVGALSFLVEAIRPVFSVSPGAGVSLLLWAGALSAAFVDNLPFTAAMLPVAAHLQAGLPELHPHVLWWALALGVSLGGNGTLIGGSANMVAMGIASSAGYPTNFARFMKFGFLYMLISVGICNVWLLVFYL